jgi:hypothetical protein
MTVSNTFISAPIVASISDNLHVKLTINLKYENFKNNYVNTC